MSYWKEFLDTLDSHGGRIFLLTAIVAVMFCAGQENNQWFAAFAGALLLALRGERAASVTGNDERREAKSARSPIPLPQTAGQASIKR